MIADAVSDGQGMLAFRELIEGIYTLTETQVPEGYVDGHVSLTVTITQNLVTMEYTVSFSGECPGAGTAADPLRIANHANCRLPNTGGSGAGRIYALGGGLALFAGAAWIWRRRIVRG